MEKFKDELAYQVYLYIENNPFINIMKLKKIFKLPKSLIIDKLSRYGFNSIKYPNEEFEILIKKMIAERNFQAIKEILNYNLLKKEWTYLYESIEDEYIPLFHLPHKYNHLIAFGKIDFNLGLKKINDYIQLCLKSNYNFSYYKFLLVKIEILRNLSRKDEIFEIYKNEKNNIKKLPNWLKYRTFGIILNSNWDRKEVLNELLKLFERLYNKQKEEWIYNLLKSIYISIGSIDKLEKLNPSDPDIYFYEGNFRKFLTFGPNSHYEGEKIAYLVKKAVANLMVGNELAFEFNLREVSRLCSRYKISYRNYEMLINLKRAIYDNLKIEINLNSLKNSLRIKDKVLYYFLKGRFNLAFQLAKKHKILTHLYINMILFRKVPKNFKNSKCLRIISRYLKLSKTLKLFEKGKFINLKVASKSVKLRKNSKAFKFLLSLINLKGHINLNNYYHFRKREVKRLISYINKKFGFQIISKNYNDIFLSVKIERTPKGVQKQ